MFPSFFLCALRSDSSLDPRPRYDDRRRGGGYGRDDPYRYRGYDRGYERRYEDRGSYDRGGYRDDRRYEDRGGYGRDYDRSYDRRDRDDGYGGRDRYGGREDRERYAPRGGGGGGGGGYDRDRYDRAAERDAPRSREPAAGGAGYSEPAPRPEGRDPYGGSGYY